ncbi:zinc finger protein 567-like [Bactrocera tryoni]|uniref:zinc finger protein 567-like n=1 Tax=Bactrocera tryoni TaxID=59916 RepID=UPI001A96ABB0|nr:zinc finger protein 567-like [Bactrocera tryoni]
MGDLLHKINSEHIGNMAEEDFFLKEWKNWCRLCARADAEYINMISGQWKMPMPAINAYSSSNIVPVIEDFFRIQIEEDDKFSKLICAECYQVVTSLINFRDRVKRVQEMYSDLQSHHHLNKLSQKSLYEKYNITENEPFLTTNSNKLPVEEIFVADLPITNVTESTEIEVKSEKKSDEVTAEILLTGFEKDDEFADPIGDINDSLGILDYAIAEEDELSTDSEQSERKFDVLNSDSENSEDRTEKNVKIHNQDLEYNYSCKRCKCSQGFQRLKNYITHMKQKHGEINCPQCADSFKNAIKLKLHMKTHPKAFSCTLCDKKFETKTRLAKHISCAHEDEQPLICEVCGLILRSRKQLREHMLQHTDYSPFECKICGTSFKIKSRLKRHMQIHGDKYICPECGKQLSTRATLKSHLLVHSDKMSHKCDYCGRLFKRANTLKNHLIAHTDLRPYACDFCDKRFSTGPSCRFHKKTMHPKELAELEASGAKTYTKNIPTLHVLKAVSRTGENFKPLASKQNGCVHFDKEIQAKTVVANSTLTTNAASEK